MCCGRHEKLLHCLLVDRRRHFTRILQIYKVSSRIPKSLRGSPLCLQETLFNIFPLESLSGRRTPRIIQNERRPKTGSLQTRPSRLQPIGSKERESPENSLLRSVSVVSSLEANSTGLSQFVKTMKNVSCYSTNQF